MGKRRSRIAPPLAANHILFSRTAEKYGICRRVQEERCWKVLLIDVKKAHLGRSAIASTLTYTSGGRQGRLLRQVA